MGQIKLTRGLTAIVDDDVYGWLGGYHWTAVPRPRGGTAAAVRKCSRCGRYGYLGYLHRQIAGVPAFCYVGFRNGSSLDCRRDNLRIFDTGGDEIEWASNTAGAYERGEDGCWVGVTWDGRYGLWRALLAGMHIGWYVAEADAARAYNAKAVEVWGEGVAKLNEIPFLSKSLACSMPMLDEVHNRRQTRKGIYQRLDGKFVLDTTVDGKRYRSTTAGSGVSERVAHEKLDAVLQAADATERMVGGEEA